MSNDSALVTLSVQAENPNTDLSRFGDIVVERHRVTYVRADGRNTPGIDVPYPLDGAANFLVPAAGEEVTIGIELNGRAGQWCRVIQHESE